MSSDIRATASGVAPGGGSMYILITIMLEYSNCTLCRQYYGAYIGFVVLWYVKRLYFSSTYIPAE